MAVRNYLILSFISLFLVAGGGVFAAGLPATGTDLGGPASGGKIPPAIGGGKAGPNQGGQTSVTNQSIFLLDSGSVDFSSATTGFHGYVCSPQNTEALCVGKTHDRGVCPKGFIPYIVTTLTKALSTSANTYHNPALTTYETSAPMNAVCPSEFWAHSGTYGYDFGFNISGTSSLGATSGSSSAFRWDIYCFPVGNNAYTTANGPDNTTKRNNPNGWSFANASTCDTNPASTLCQGQAPAQICQAATVPGNMPFLSRPSQTYDKPPFVMDSGILDIKTNEWIQTNKVCPENYYPHIELAINKSSANVATSGSTGLANACPYASSFPGTNFYQEAYSGGQRYAMRLKFGNNPGTQKNLGIQWTLMCYPGSTWSGGTEYDTTCDQLVTESVQYSQAYPFSAYSDCSDPACARTVANYSYLYAVSRTSTGVGPLYNTAGGAVVIPYTGTYQLDLRMNIVNPNQSGTACTSYDLYVNNAYRTSFRANTSSTTWTTWSMIRTPASTGTTAGISNVLLTVPSLSLTAGDRAYVQMGVWGSTQGGCINVVSPIDITSDGSLTITRTGS